LEKKAIFSPEVLKIMTRINLMATGLVGEIAKFWNWEIGKLIQKQLS
jgi:hypothetical protein